MKRQVTKLGPPLLWHWESHRPEETEALGHSLGRAALPASVLALEGDLGAGKTCLVRGLAAGLDSRDRVSSPTFTVEGIYEGRLQLHHFDAYFQAKAASYLELGGEEAFYGEGVAAIEWAERVPEFLPTDHLRIALNHSGEEHRSVKAEAFGPLARRWLAATVALLTGEILVLSDDESPSA